MMAVIFVGQWRRPSPGCGHGFVWGVDVLCEIEALKDAQKFDGLCTAGVVSVDVEVAKEKDGWGDGKKLCEEVEKWS